MLSLKTSYAVLPRAVAILAVAVTSIMTLASSLAWGGDAIQLHTFKTHSRLSFRMDTGIEPSWKDTADGFELFLKGMILADLGCPLGQEQEWIQERQARLKDSRIASLQLKEFPNGIRVVGKWKFPEGNLALANPSMEHFDYTDKNNPSFVVDFWVKSGPTLAEARTIERRRQEKQAYEKAANHAKKIANRKIASQKIKVAIEDIGAFCKEPLKDDKDIFLQFSPARQKFVLSKYLPSTTADTNYTYLKPTSETEEAKYIRLALDLYAQGKTALVNRTIDFFEEKFPKSEFRHQMRFLRANALIKLGYQEQAHQILAQLMVDVRESAVAVQSAMFLATKAMEKNTYLLALENFLWLTNYHPKHQLSWVFHMGAAEALFAMKETDRAAKEYLWVSLEAPTRLNQAEGAMRLGDLYLDRKQYESALAAYFKGMDRFKKESEEFPTVSLNRAEALYWIGEYAKAEEGFKGFLENFPSHPSGWRATFRLGEIFARRSEPKDVEQSRKWFFDTINRFPFSPGATLARLRLMPCGDHGGFNVESAQAFLSKEAKHFSGNGEISLEKYNEFRTLAGVRSLTSFGKEQEAIQYVNSEFDQPLGVQGRQLLTELYSKLLRRSVLKLLESGDEYQALVFYQEKSKILKKQRYILEKKSGFVNYIEESDYLLKLSLAASHLGLGSLARDLDAAYKDVEKNVVARRSPASTSEGEQDPAKLAEKSYAEAKALWVQKGSSAEGEIQELLSKVSSDSSYAYQKELIQALIDDASDRPALALAHVSRAALLVPFGNASVQQNELSRLHYWSARLQAELGQYEAAIGFYRDLQTAPAFNKSVVGPAAALGVMPPPAMSNLIMAEADLLVKLEKWGDAAKAYNRAIQSGESGNKALFEYARALKKTGSRKDYATAGQTLKKLAESKVDDFWKKLALEALANQKAREGLKNE